MVALVTVASAVCYYVSNEAAKVDAAADPAAATAFFAIASVLKY